MVMKLKEEIKKLEGEASEQRKQLQVIASQIQSLEMKKQTILQSYLKTTGGIEALKNINGGLDEDKT